MGKSRTKSFGSKGAEVCLFGFGFFACCFSWEKGSEAVLCHLSCEGNMYHAKMCKASLFIQWFHFELKQPAPVVFFFLGGEGWNECRYQLFFLVVAQKHREMWRDATYGQDNLGFGAKSL